MKNKQIHVKNKQKYLTADNLPDMLTGDVYYKHELIACPVCEGVGYSSRENVYDYFTSEYRTVRYKCEKCNGDGRLIRKTTGIRVHQVKEQVYDMPYSEFKDFVKPFYNEERWFRTRLDRNDDDMNKKYPELAAVKYERYDELLKKYEMFEKLKDDDEPDQ
jgi:hypothetical protein